MSESGIVWELGCAMTFVMHERYNIKHQTQHTALPELSKSQNVAAGQLQQCEQEGFEYLSAH